MPPRSPSLGAGPRHGARHRPAAAATLGAEHGWASGHRLALEEWVADHTVTGKIGRVTATVSPGRLGEVMVQVRGGSEAFNAYGAEGEDTLLPGTRIVVVDYYPPRTVVVTKM